MFAPKTFVIDLLAELAVQMVEVLFGCKFTPASKITAEARSAGCDPNDPPLEGYTLFGLIETPFGQCFCVWRMGTMTAFVPCS